MAALAAQQGVRTVVGLQARQAPAIEFVQELLSDGYVGDVLSTTMVGLSIPVRRHEVLAAIERSAATGERVKT